jgi:hypothetical protein
LVYPKGYFSRGYPQPTAYKVSKEIIMNQYTYYIVDSEGYILLTVISQPTNLRSEDEAKVSVLPLLPVIAAQYGLDNVFYTEE